MATNDIPAPSEDFVLTHTLIVRNIKASCEWYKTMLNGKVVMDPGEGQDPCVLKAANNWIVINVGGGEPTPDKPNTTVKVKDDHDALSEFLNIRVANIQDFCTTRKEFGADFITEPKDFSREIRCYMRDPDGYLIEVSQAK